MKTEIHPSYHVNAVITCANCGSTFQFGSTQENIRVEICSRCHPFFTGKKVLIDTEGRVDRFRQKLAGAKGRDKKVRKKKTLEERFNEELTIQFQKTKEEEAKPRKKVKKNV